MLYALGAFLGVASVFYFGFEIIQQFSPVTKSVLLLLAFFLFVALGSYFRDRLLSGAMYVIGAGTYIVFLAYTFGAFKFSSDAIFLTLGASSVLFIVLGYAKQHDRLDLERDILRNVVIGIVVLGVLLAGIDIAGAQPTYDATFAEEIDFGAVNTEQREPLEIGTLTVTNSFVLPRDVDMPGYRGCLYYDGERFERPIHVEDGFDRVGGNSERSAPLIYYAVFPAPEHENVTIDGVVPVEERESCPASSEDDRIVVVPDNSRMYAVSRDDPR